MKTYHCNDCIVDSITMQYRNTKNFQEIHGNRNPYSVTDEKRLQQFENYTIDKDDWNVILNLLTTAVYDESQWNREKNPNGDRERILPYDKL